MVADGGASPAHSPCLWCPRSRGRANEALLELIRINVRIPDVVLGDLQAQLAACRIGERGVSELARRYGIEGLERHFEELLAYSERAARQTIRSIPDGVYHYTDFLDDDGVHPDRPVPIRVAVEVRDDEVTFDFAGSSPQVAGAINCTLSFVKSAVYFALRSVMSSDAPNNAGFFRPITVKAELGSILNPRSPGACAARGVTGFRVIDAITGALAEAVPERIRAPGEGGTTSYSVSGYDADGTFNMYREAVMGNWGGGAHRDGLDGVANPAANIGNAPCEVVERQAPLRIERYELVPDSGGAGQWRGGLAVMRQLRYLGERATLQLRSDRRHHRPFGVHGGLPGAASTNLLLDDGREEQWPTKFVRPLLRNQAIRHVTAGAGGYGDPLLRDPARVLDDVRNGKVSVQAAERDYGVRVSGPPWCVEEPATRALRAARASSPATAPGPRRQATRGPVARGSASTSAGPSPISWHGAGSGLAGVELARGIFEVVTETMASAARVHIAERGRDPRRYVLHATGGAGPVHAWYLAARLGIERAAR